MGSLARDMDRRRRGAYYKSRRVPSGRSAGETLPVRPNVTQRRLLALNTPRSTKSIRPVVGFRISLRLFQISLPAWRGWRSRTFRNYDALCAPLDIYICCGMGGLRGAKNLAIQTSRRKSRIFATITTRKKKRRSKRKRKRRREKKPPGRRDKETRKPTENKKKH